MIHTDKDNYILGWNSPTKDQLKELAKATELRDRHGNLQYKYTEIDGTIKGIGIDGEVTEEPTKIITVTYDPQPLTAEQKEKDREQLIESKIPYTIGQELALINKGIKDRKNLEYLEYRATVEKIKGETK